MIRILPAPHCPSCPICGRRTDWFALCDDEMPGDPPSLWWGGLSPGDLISGMLGFWVHFDVDDEHHVTYLNYEQPDLPSDEK